MSERKAIELTGLSKRFGTTLAVNAVSLSVERGSCYGLIGPNGAGKTTTFSMMCGFLKPSAGQIRILDVDPSQPGALKRKVGVLPQDAVLPPWARVGWLLTYWAKLSGLDAPEREAREALDKVGLPETWNKLAGALSHGMGKRVAMAQALMGSPPVVLLDEPTAGLDPKIAAQVRQVIREMAGKQTVVVSSHNLQELEELCDGAAILDRGKLVQAGSMAQFTSKAEEFRVQLARGQVPLDELRALPGCTAASVDANGVLHVSYDGAAPPEEMITRVVGVLIQRGVLILGVSRGRKLEERVLQLT
ncbi:MAG TPA: ABC transporter ATP-binding protein [Myxococcaceae bacterium]|nr:ABC transporter ATP-binding protein [Myxococcaceae bacterium]